MPHLFRILAILLLLQFGALAGASAQAPDVPGGTAPGSAPATSEERAPEAQASLSDLIRILETEETRNRLIESLRSLAYQPPAGAAEASGETQDAEAEADLGLSVPAVLASYTRSGVEALQGGALGAIEVAQDARRLIAGTEAINIPRIFNAMLPVLSVAVATIAVYFLLTLALRPLLDFLARKAKPGRPIRKLGLLSLALLAGVAKIFIAGVGGHVAAVVFDAGPPNFNQALFLNAFVLTGLIEVVLSVFAAPFHPSLRMTPFSDGQARYWYVRIAFLILLLGYTFMFVAPIVDLNSTMRAGNAVRFMVVIAAYAIMVTLILQNRVHVRSRLQRGLLSGRTDFQSKANYLLGHLWWVLALGFVTALFVLWLSSPRTGFQFMLVASLESLAAITVGGLAITILSRAISSGIRIPPATQERFPLLERRVNGFIPRLLFILRAVVIVLVLAALLQAWSVAELGDWVASSIGQRVVGGGFSALMVLCVAFAIYLVVSSWVEYRLNPKFGTVPTARERTLLALFRNAFTIVLGVITLMLVLSQVGINIAPLLAGAGVVGLAVGFGAQKLVEDIITGAFIQIENVMNEGDVVMIGETSGTVEKLTIRSVSLRSADGTYHLIPFSSVAQVSNMTKDFANFVADIEVGYREDMDEVRAAMLEAATRLRDSEQGLNVISEFDFLGVEILGPTSITVRGQMRTLPGKQWGVGRLYKRLVRETLAARGIEIAVPQTQVWFDTETAEHARRRLNPELAGGTGTLPAGAVGGA